MSNNKQSMKLYTEEEIIRAIELSDGRSIDEVLAALTPIEMPSDDEIISENQLSEFNSEDVAYYNGAKWMRDKIQGGNK
jgi:hypothetical protein